MSLVMNGINPDAKRHPDDFYVTEPRAVIELMEALESLEIGLPPIVVDSSVGSGIIADAVQLYGHDRRGGSRLGGYTPPGLFDGKGRRSAGRVRNYSKSAF